MTSYMTEPDLKEVRALGSDAHRGNNKQSSSCTTGSNKAAPVVTHLNMCCRWERRREVDDTCHFISKGRGHQVSLTTNKR